MKIVIPLAGPDFESGDDATKAELLIDGRPLLRRALEGRPWWRRGDVSATDLVFVLRESEPSRRFARDRLPAWYPGSSQVFLSNYTGGAALSALSGVALFAHREEPVCIDLVDIEYESDCDPASLMRNACAAALALVFPSSNPAYSYLRTDDTGSVVEAAEKKTISLNASAGTYFFASAAVYLRALAHNLDFRSTVTHRGLFFVCPLYNGVVAEGGRVLLETVSCVRDVKVDQSA